MRSTILLAALVGLAMFSYGCARSSNSKQNPNKDKTTTTQTTSRSDTERERDRSQFELPRDDSQSDPSLGDRNQFGPTANQTVNGIPVNQNNGVPFGQGGFGQGGFGSGGFNQGGIGGQNQINQIIGNWNGMDDRAPNGVAITNLRRTPEVQ